MSVVALAKRFSPKSCFAEKKSRALPGFFSPPFHPQGSPASPALSAAPLWGVAHKRGRASLLCVRTSVVSPRGA